MKAQFNFSSRENDFNGKRNKTILYSGCCCCCCCLHWIGAAIGGITGYRSGWKKAEKKHGPINREFRKKVAWATAGGWLLGGLFITACAVLGQIGEMILVAVAFVPVLFLLFPAATAIAASSSGADNNGNDEDATSSTPSAWLPCLWMFLHAVAGTILGYLLIWAIVIILD